MGNRTREFPVEVRKLPKRARKRALVGQRARPTPERMRRAGADFEQGDTGQITMPGQPAGACPRAQRDHPGALRGRAEISPSLVLAGLNDPIGSIDLARIFGTDLGAFFRHGEDGNQLFHRQRYREAVQAIGKIGSHVLDWALCRETALEQVGYSLGWTSRPQGLRRGGRTDEDRAGRAVPAVGDRQRWGASVDGANDAAFELPELAAVIIEPERFKRRARLFRFHADSVTMRSATLRSCRMKRAKSSSLASAGSTARSMNMRLEVRSSTIRATSLASLAMIGLGVPAGAGGRTTWRDSSLRCAPPPASEHRGTVASASCSSRRAP